MFETVSNLKNVHILSKEEQKKTIGKNVCICPENPISCIVQSFCDTKEY